MSILDASGRPIAREDIARVRAKAMMDGMVGFGQVYNSATHGGTFFSAWPTRLQSADRDWFAARYTATGRARDLYRNNPVAKSIVSRKKNAAVGRGWRFTSKPNARALGIDPMTARELGQLIGTEWSLFASSYDFQSDADRMRSFGQNLRLASSHLMIDGEFCAKVEYEADAPTRYKTRLRLFDPDRLSNPQGQMDTDSLRAGVQLKAGVPVGYWIRERHPVDVVFSSNTMTWTYHPRYSTPLGRPNVLHGFDPERASQTRGISAFVSSLESFRGFDQFTRATIQSAVINSLIVGFMKSSAGPEAVSDSLSAPDLLKFSDQRTDYYKENPVQMGDAVLPVLPLGDELKLQTASKDVGSFDAFVRAIIRLVAASLGVTYEEASMDYSQTNYSSARAALIHAWADTLAFMGTLEAHLVRPFFVAWLEEAFDNGYISPPPGAPDFYDAIDAYASGRWLGPGRGYIDPTKEILAAAARIEAGISTLEDECADQGKDYEEVLDQLAFEKQLRIERGLISEQDALAQAFEDTRNPTRTAPDDKPSALSEIRAFADTPGHETWLDARP